MSHYPGSQTIKHSKTSNISSMVGIKEASGLEIDAKEFAVQKQLDIAEKIPADEQASTVDAVVFTIIKNKQTLYWKYATQ